MVRGGRERRRAAPVTGRVAGLPVEVAEGFATELPGEAGALFRLEDELAGLRAALADAIHAAVPGAAPEVRRFLLAVRRDCHNGRPLARHAGTPGWPHLLALAGPLATRLAEREAEAGARWDAFRDAFEGERERQRAALREPLRDPAFLRGLALASPDLFDACRPLAGAAPGPMGRRDARTEGALLRYVVRASVKVSPFSTFTPVALGAVRRDAGPAGLRLRGAGWGARSLVRLKRYRLQQYTDALCRYAPFRDRLAVVMNDSAVETEPGRALFLRPGEWEEDAARGTLRYRPEALVRAGTSGPVATSAAALLSAERLSYGELRARLEAGVSPDERGAVGAELDRLLGLGLLRLVVPWPAHAGHQEARILRTLREMPRDPALEPFITRLERLVALERGYPRAEDPAASVREIRRLADELWEALAPLGGGDAAGTAYRGTKRFDLYEDVHLVPGAEEVRGGPLFHLSRDAADAALRSAAPLVRLAALFDHRHELRATLASLAEDRWPGREEVGALELFAEARPLWQEYLAFRAAGWKEREPGRTWNPRGLAELEELRRWRRAVLDGLDACVTAGEGEGRVAADALDALLAPVPARYTGTDEWGACLFLQPASADGSAWRLNGLREGTGRCGSRFTPVMPRGMRRRYTRHLRERGTVTVDGERAELLDLLCVQGDTLNVHALQTPAVLAFPGEEAGVPPRRRVSLSGLRVRFQGPERIPRLRGRDGRLFLPVHLGLAFEAYMPPVVRFLCAFGPSEMGLVLPSAPTRQDGEVEVRERTRLGSLVLHRRSWSVPAALLAAALAGEDDARAFAAANRLRAAWGLPGQVFFAEASPHPLAGTVRKPRYLDFTSPLFLPVLREAVEATGERLVLEEMLPGPGMLPRDAAGRRWAVEIVADSLALGRRPPGRAGSPVQTRARAGRTPAGHAAG